jgi:hypothetical protein
MSTGDRHDPGRYEIRLGDHLESRWAAWFDGMTLTHESDGTTSIHGPVSTRPHCTACCARFTTWGLPLLAVTQVQPDPPAVPPIDRR